MPPVDPHPDTVAELRAEVREDFRAVRKQIGGIAEAQHELKARVAFVEGEMSGSIQGLRDDVADVKKDVGEVRKAILHDTGITARVGAKDVRSLLMVVVAVLTAGVLGGGADTALKMMGHLVGLKATP